MNKRTISAILYGIMICLTLAIVVLVVKIGMRGPKTEVDELALNKVVVSDNGVIEDDPGEDPVKEKELICTPYLDNATSSVNVRSGPGADYERLGSAYPDCEYVVLEVMSSGWTRIDYDGNEAYISSNYVKYQFRLELGDGTYSYSEATAADIKNYRANGVADAEYKEPVSTSDNSASDNSTSDNSVE